MWLNYKQRTSYKKIAKALNVQIETPLETWFACSKLKEEWLHCLDGAEKGSYQWLDF